jgi:hypothetical protein
MKTASTPTFGMNDSFQAGLQIERYTLARSVATILGAVFVAIGVIGFVAPGLMGTHLSLTHNLIHLVSGTASLYFGLFGTASGVYGMLAVAGFAFGVPDQHTVQGIVHGADTRLLKLIPGSFELATPDHLIHTAMAILYFAGGVIGAPPQSTRRTNTPPTMPGRTPAPPPPPL